jgi:hypothetical protein
MICQLKSGGVLGPDYDKLALQIDEFEFELALETLHAAKPYLSVSFGNGAT